MAQPTRPRNGQSKRTVPGLSAITVAGFKSLADETRIDIRPLTILAGANSSGKSSAMQPLLMLKQTLEAAYDPGPLMLSGPHVRFTRADQMFTQRNQRKRVDTCTVEIEDSRTAIANVYARGGKQRLRLVETRYSSLGQTVTLRVDMSDDAIRAALPADSLQRIERMVASPTNLELSVDTRGISLIVEAQDPQRQSTLQVYPSPFLGTSFDVTRSITSVLHLPGLRGNPERTYPISAVGGRFAGTFNSYVASVIYDWKTANDDRLNLIARDLATLDLTWKVDALPIDDTQVELRVGRLRRAARGGAQDMVSIADVGIGVSQTLPVVVALQAAQPGQLVYIEQPEIHLHPRAQLAMAGLLADAARRGVRVVAETHSNLLLLGVQTLVAQRALDPSLVKLHWFTRDDDGMTHVDSRDLDADGAFGEWPADFGKVEMAAENEYLRLVEARMFDRAT